MPMFWADFIADTQHLDAAESGAYLLLIGHYWSTGRPPPDDDRQLARIARMSPADWRRARPIIRAFFQDGWKHKRVEFELTEAARISAAGRAGGKASARARRQKKPNNIKATCERPLQNRSNDPPTKREALQPQPQYSEANASAAGAAGPVLEVVGEDPKARLFRVGKTALVSFGVAEKRTGALIGQWLKAKNDSIGLLAAIQFARDQNVADPIAYVSALVHGKRKHDATGSLAAAADDLIARAREREKQGGHGFFDLAAESA
jgi:uncharacterized protein YdaU (DUF1376 family)